MRARSATFPLLSDGRALQGPLLVLLQLGAAARVVRNQLARRVVSPFYFEDPRAPCDGDPAVPSASDKPCFLCLVPSHIVLSICSYLDFRDLIRLSHCNHTMRSFGEHRSLWRALYFQLEATCVRPSAYRIHLADTHWKNAFVSAVVSGKRQGYVQLES